MWKDRYNRLQRVKNRIKWKKRWHIHIFVILITFLLFFLFSSNIVVDEKTWLIKIVDTPKIETEDFTKLYSWKIKIWGTLDFDIDLTNVYLTWTTANIEFSNNEYFISYPSLSDKNINKIRFWYMLWKSRNRNKVFRVWKGTESIKKFSHNILNDNEDWKLYFRWANLWWTWNLYVKIIINWKKIIKKD